MIVMGYPGIGKTTYAKVDKSYAIDLESSLFPDKDTYVDVAIDLESQGYIVFVSCHDEVRDLLLQKVSPGVSLGVCYPEISLRGEWDMRLKRRYDKDPSDKNGRAYLRFVNHFDEDIRNIKNSKVFSAFDHIVIRDPYYQFVTLKAYKYPYGYECSRRLSIDYPKPYEAECR